MFDLINIDQATSGLNDRRRSSVFFIFLWNFPTHHTDLKPNDVAVLFIWKNNTAGGDQPRLGNRTVFVGFKI